MQNIFDMDLKNLLALRRFYKAAPTEFRVATANVLNTLAFKTRQLDIDNISRQMIIRNPAFLRNSIKFEKAKYNQPISQQVAIEGSVKLGKSTGWFEQETGAIPKHQTYPATLQARGGNLRKIIQTKARYKSSNIFYKPGQFKARTQAQSFGMMLRNIANAGTGQFILSQSVITKQHTYQPGMYMFRNKHIILLRGIGKNKHPRTIGWHTQSINQLKTQNNMSDVWAQSIKTIVDRHKK